MICEACGNDFIAIQVAVLEGEGKVDGLGGIQATILNPENEIDLSESVVGHAVCDIA